MTGAAGGGPVRRAAGWPGYCLTGASGVCPRTDARPPRGAPPADRRRGSPPGICARSRTSSRRGAAEHAQVEVRPGQPPPALSATAGQHSRDGEFPGPAGPGQFSGVAGDAARPATHPPGPRPGARAGPNHAARRRYPRRATRACHHRPAGRPAQGSSTPPPPGEPATGRPRWPNAGPSCVRAIRPVTGEHGNARDNEPPVSGGAADPSYPQVRAQSSQVVAGDGFEPS